MASESSLRAAVKEALRLLEVDQLILAIHDQSFPSRSDEEIGRGSPYSRGGSDFFNFAADLGFTAVQLGPQGRTTLANSSPYDGTIFSRNELSTSLFDLTGSGWNSILDAQLLEDLVAKCPDSASKSDEIAHYSYAWKANRTALEAAYSQFRKRSDLITLRAGMDEWVSIQSMVGDGWLARDTMFEALAADYGTDDWRTWSESDRRLYASPSPLSQQRLSELSTKYSYLIGFYEFCQFIIHRQHRDLRDQLKACGLTLFGDMQVGYSQRDMWSRSSLLMPGYAMGAPPSRTNPDGQPWGYPVLNPELYFDQLAENGRGAALAFILERARKMFLEYDGVRIDHPHGLVCPWVYKSDELDAMHAVQTGARLFESPDLPEHPRLSEYSIVRPDQLNPDVPRYADQWVKDLEWSQVEKFSVQFDLIINLARQNSRILCEVLSSCPYPLRRVLERHELGRFRVTQKSDLTNPDDQYRSENAKPPDLVMASNHDTKPLWLVVDEWFEQGQNEARAAYLAERLERDQRKREETRRRLAFSKNEMCQAMFADLFASPSRSVSIFFADVFGMKEIYNRPGTVSDANWALRVPSDFVGEYDKRQATGAALCLPAVLATALAAQFSEPPEPVQALIAHLQRAHGSTERT